MIIIISDLHFADGSAGYHNISTDAFTIFFKDIARICEWIKNDKGTAISEIKLVFLGDIFDLLRTEMWFSVPSDDRPWGFNEQKIEEDSHNIFDAITTNNSSTFAVFGGSLKD